MKQNNILSSKVGLLLLSLNMSFLPINNVFTQKTNFSSPEIEQTLSQPLSPDEVKEIQEFITNTYADGENSTTNEIQSTFEPPSEAFLQDAISQLSSDYDQFSRELLSHWNEFDAFMNSLYKEEISQKDSEHITIAEAGFDVHSVGEWLANSKLLIIILLALGAAFWASSKGRTRFGNKANNAEGCFGKALGVLAFLLVISITFKYFYKSSLDKAIDKGTQAIKFIPPKYRDKIADGAKEFIDEAGQAASTAGKTLGDQTLSQQNGVLASILGTIISLAIGGWLIKKSKTTGLKKGGAYLVFLFLGRFFVPVGYDMRRGDDLGYSSSRSSGSSGSGSSLYDPGGGESKPLDADQQIEIQKRQTLNPNGMGTYETSSSNSKIDNIFDYFNDLLSTKGTSKINGTIKVSGTLDGVKTSIKNYIHASCETKKDNSGGEHKFIRFTTQDALGGNLVIVWENGGLTVKEIPKKEIGHDCPYTYIACYKGPGDSERRISIGIEGVSNKDTETIIGNPVAQMIALTNAM